MKGFAYIIDTITLGMTPGAAASSEEILCQSRSISACVDRMSNKGKINEAIARLSLRRLLYPDSCGLLKWSVLTPALSDSRCNITREDGQLMVTSVLPPRHRGIRRELE